MKKSSFTIDQSYFSRKVHSILGLPFDELSQQEALDTVISFIDNKQRCFLTTPNLNFLIAAQRDSEFYQSVIESDISIADGMPIVWVAKLLAIPIKERVAGSTLFAELSSLEGRKNKISVFFFGGQAGIAKQASDKLNKHSKSMICCGYHDPGFGSIEEMSTESIIQKINQTNADFLVVALGAGKGQAWIQKNKQHLNTPVISHLGAVINFVAGNVERAPVFWQRFGVEWLWRIKQEPLLWKRYFFDGLVFVKLILTKVMPLVLYDRHLRSCAAYNMPMEAVFDSSNSQCLHLSGSIKLSELEELKDIFSAILDSEGSKVVLNFSKVTYIDASFIGLLLLFQNILKQQGKELFLQGLTNKVRRILSLSNVSERFQ